MEFNESGMPKQWTTKIQTMASRHCIKQRGTKTFHHGPTAANTFKGAGANGERWLYFFLKQSTKWSWWVFIIIKLKLTYDLTQNELWYRATTAASCFSSEKIVSDAFEDSQSQMWHISREAGPKRWILVDTQITNAHTCKWNPKAIFCKHWTLLKLFVATAWPPSGQMCLAMFLIPKNNKLSKSFQNSFKNEYKKLSNN